MHLPKKLLLISEKWNDDQFRFNIIAKASVVPGFLAAQHAILAAELEITTNISTTASNLITEIRTAYCNSICWLLFLIELGFYLFSKDEKKIAIAKKCFFGCFIFYVILKLTGNDGGIIGKSADKVSEWMGGK